MLKPDLHPGIPEKTVKVARAALPNGNMYLSLRDTLGAIFEDETFQDLYPTLGQPAESPGRLALVTVMQYVENLSDQEAVPCKNLIQSVLPQKTGTPVCLQ